MGMDSKIEWCHHTFSPWWGCVKVSPGCTNCYAEAFDHRLGGDHWGPRASRRFMSEAHWRKPVAWNRKAARAGERHRVFCASMADVFEDRSDLIGWRYRLFHLISETPNLDWLLLTKRPQNFHLRDEPWMRELPNVWLGVTAEDQQRADERIPLLLQEPAAVRFVSYEPAIEAVEFQHERGYLMPFKETDPSLQRTPRVDWVIAGAESGPGARPMNLEWVRSVRDQCQSAGTSFFLKQKLEGGKKLSLPEIDGRRWAEFPS